MQVRAVHERAPGDPAARRDEVNVFPPEGGDLARPQPQPAQETDHAGIPGGRCMTHKGSELLRSRSNRAQMRGVARPGIDPQPGTQRRPPALVSTGHRDLGDLEQHWQHLAAHVAHVSGMAVEAVNGHQRRPERSLTRATALPAPGARPHGEPALNQMPSQLACRVLPTQITGATPLLEPLEMPRVGLRRRFRPAPAEPQVPQIAIDRTDRLQHDSAEHRPIR
jgi:hypothetical protein